MQCMSRARVASGPIRAVRDGGRRGRRGWAAARRPAFAMQRPLAVGRSLRRRRRGAPGPGSPHAPGAPRRRG